MSLREEVEAALDDGPGLNRDRAAAALALTYASLIDNAAPDAKYAAALAWLGTVRVEDAAQERQRVIIETALSAHTVASDLGPKLLAALDALGLTPRARKAVTPGAQQPSTNPVNELAAARARLGYPEAVDAAAS